MGIKKRVKCLGILFISTIVLSAHVSAANEPVGANGVKITGQTACKKKDCMAGLMVWSPDKSMADLHKETDKRKYTQSVVYSNQTLTDKNGSFEFEFELKNRKSGIYKAYISCGCSEGFTEENILYSNPEENKIALGLLNEAAKSENYVEDINKIINEYGIALGFEGYENVSSEAAKILGNYIKENPFAEDDKIKAIKTYKKAVAVSEIKSGKITDVTECKSELGLDESALKDLYKLGFVDDNFKKNWTKLIKDMDWETIAEFDSTIEEAFVLTTVRYPDGYANIIKVIDVFYKKTGLSSGIDKTIAIGISNKAYESYEDLYSAIKNIKPSSGNGGSSSGGGSYSGGGKLLGGSDLSYSQDYMANVELNLANDCVFTDIDGVEWAKNAIVTLADEKIISGKGNGKFCPNDYITREEFVKLIVSAFIPNGKKADVSFVDVSENAWYSDYVKIAYGSEIVKGISDDVFGAGENITRQDMAVIARRVVEICGLKTDIDNEKEQFVFSDDEMISDYAKSDIYDLYKMNMINGVDENRFAPVELVTRAQAAKIIYNLYMINQ